MEQYAKIMNKSSGYFSVDGVPYHSVETLMVEAPDYGHETTSEAFSEYIWLTALNIWATDGKNTQDFIKAWTMLDKYIVPDVPFDQPDNSGYNPTSPAEYAPEEDSPSGYPVPLDGNHKVQVGVDPLSNELANAYGQSEFYATHWLLDVDNIYGFGKHESGNSNDRNVYVNSYQRGPNESVWRTIPQPEWENFKFGQNSSSNGGCGYLSLFDSDPSGCKPQWRYTGAPDADARTIQGTYWAYNFTQTLLDEKQKDNISDDINVIIQNATKLSDYIRYAMFDKYFKQVPCYDVDCPAGQWQAAYNSSTYLLNWYMAWGGAIPGQFGSWSWRIGASHAHQGYQNVMTAHVISEVDAFKSKTQNGVNQWSKVKQTTLDLWQWLQSAEGPLAGGVTNSVGGRYLDPASRNITGFFKGLSYQWEPVYDDPPSNNWFGMNAWSQERNAEYYYLTGDEQAKTILDKWYKWIESLKDKIILDNNDFAIPSNLHWEGQPTTWDGTGEIPTQDNLHGTVIDYSKDVGVGSALAHTLTFYAAASGNSDAQTMARELLDRMYLYADDIGIGINETRQDYIGNEYGAGFWEAVYVPEGYIGYYPNGDVIKPGINFTDIRSWYKSDPWWPYIQQCKDKNVAPSLIYHRLWAQVEYALACGDYARLFGSSSKYYVGFDNDKYY